MLTIKCLITRFATDATRVVGLMLSIREALYQRAQVMLEVVALRHVHAPVDFVYRLRHVGVQHCWPNRTLEYEECS